MPYFTWRSRSAAVAALLAGALAVDVDCPVGGDATTSCTATSNDQASRLEFVEGVSLISLSNVQTLAHTLRRTRSAPESERPSCSLLQNRQTHFTVNVSVGTPAQVLSVVADTGSNALIIESCVCQDKGLCDEKSKCFRGMGRSSTFVYEPSSEELVVSFGSGDIEGATAVDVVNVAGVSCNMTDGIMLMISQALDFDDSGFEGIMGLGPPLPLVDQAMEEDAREQTDAESFDDLWKDIIGSGPDEEGRSEEAAVQPERMLGKSDMLKATRRSPVHQPTGFLEQANVSRFSMCFNSGADGVLRVNIPQLPHAHDNVGTEHWGLALEGIAVGHHGALVQVRGPGSSHKGGEHGHAPEGKHESAASHSSSLTSLCSKEDMKAGQETPCGVIPDSGTTMITGPTEHLEPLYEAICDSWPRCRENYTALSAAVEAAEEAITRVYKTNPFEFQMSSKGDVLSMLLSDCSTWLEEANMGELPPVHFFVSGGDTSASQTITIPGHSWLIQTMREGYQHEHRFVEGYGAVPTGNIIGTGRREKVCAPAFDPLEYPTKKNGPVWILGTPLFYEYTVGYDLDNKKISLRSQQEDPCGACDAQVGLLSSRADSRGGGARMPRQQLGKPRAPSIDVSRPF